MRNLSALRRMYNLQKQRNDEPWFLYLVANDESCVVKIGITQTPKRRISHLQVGNHVTLKMYCLVSYATREDAQDAERLLHIRLDQFHIGGEWFKKNPCCDELMFGGKAITSESRSERTDILSQPKENRKLQFSLRL